MSPKKNIKSYHQLKAIGERQRTVLTQTMQIRPKKRSIRSCFAARGMDILLSCLGLGLGAIPMLAIAAAIKVNSKGPVLYRQKRVGKDGKLFSILKFRTMCHDAERETGPVWAKANDPRQTSLGTFLRQTKLDELPQLLNILWGEMTFVGPRPERPEFVSQFIRYMPPFSLRHQVKPGLTGLAQLRNGYDNSAASVYRKLRWDVEYIRRKCVRFDMWLISLTGKLLFQNMRFELATRMKLKCSPKKNGCIVSKNPILERR